MKIKVPVTEKTLEALARGSEPLIAVDLEKKEAVREKQKSYLIVDYTLQRPYSDGRNCGTYSLKDVKQAFLETDLFAEYVDLFPCKVTRLSNMQIVFDDRWNRTTIINLVESHPYLEFGKHEDLKAVCVCPYVEDGEEDFTPDYRRAYDYVAGKAAEAGVRI